MVSTLPAPSVEYPKNQKIAPPRTNVNTWSFHNENLRSIPMKVQHEQLYSMSLGPRTTAPNNSKANKQGSTTLNSVCPHFLKLTKNSFTFVTNPLDICIHHSPWGEMLTIDSTSSSHTHPWLQILAVYGKEAFAIDARQE